MTDDRLGQKWEKSRIPATIVGTLAILLLVWLMNFLLNYESSPASPSSPSASSKLRTIPQPARQLSGNFTIPAGKGPEETKVWISRNEIVWIAAEPKAKLFDCRSGQTIEIGPNGWTSPPTRKRGRLTFLKGPEASQVDYSIIN